MVTGWFWMALAGSGWFWVAMARSGLLWLHPWISNAENKQGGGRLRIIITSSFNVDIKNKVTKLLMYIYPYSMFVGKMCIRGNVKVSQPKIYIWYSFWAKDFWFHIESWPEIESWPKWDSNRWPYAYHAHTLTTELFGWTTRCS